MKRIAFAAGLCIAAIGAVGIIAPASLDWLAGLFVSSGAFYAVAAIRIAIGLVLISAAAASRAPRALRILGYVVVVAGVITALMGLLAPEQARAMIEAWQQQGPGVVRLSAVPVLALGAFIAYASAP